jgi:thiol-disulfide isomerase/thioredoxin
MLYFSALDIYENSIMRVYFIIGLFIWAFAAEANDIQLKSSSNLAATPILNSQSSISSVKANKPLLLQFWASWCHSCGTIMWDMDKLLSQHHHFAYAAVSIDSKFADASNYLKKHTLAKKHQDSFYFDKDGMMASQFKVKSVPTIILIDQYDNICFRTTGHLNSDDLFELSKIMKTMKNNQCNQGIN